MHNLIFETVKDQLNIAEGFARKTDKEFARFLVHSHGSAAEVQAALYVALDQKYITQDEFRSLYSLVDKVSSMVMKFAVYLTKEEHK